MVSRHFVTTHNEKKNKKYQTNKNLVKSWTKPHLTRLSVYGAQSKKSWLKIERSSDKRKNFKQLADLFATTMENFMTAALCICEWVCVSVCVYVRRGGGQLALSDD